MRRGLLTVALVLASPSAAGAQAVDLTRPDPIAERLTEVRLEVHGERREAGAVLMAEGFASLLAGALIAGLGNDDPFLLGHGIGHAGWGAVNAALALGLLDLGEGARARIEAERGALRGEALADAREALIRDRHRAATLFALNLGLDVLYVLGGALLFGIAELLDDANDAEILRGYSSAQIGQGGFLLVFDLVEWIRAASAADRAAAVPRPRW